MTPTRSLAAALAIGSVLGISCYSEPLPPSTYRYACEADGDCNANERCLRGRCEQPCSTVEVVAAGLLGADQPCPIESGFAACVNGTCANTCAVGSSFCPPSYECMALDIDLGGGSSNPFGGGSDEEIGICAIKCEPGDGTCPAGEACDDGICLPLDCSTGQACPADHTCFFGLCMPSCAGGQACPEGLACSALFGVCEPTCFPACTAGEACFFGACALECSESDQCPEGQACFLGFCAPEEEGGTTTTGTEETGATTEGSSSGAGTTVDASTSGPTTGMGADPADDEERR